MRFLALAALVLRVLLALLPLSTLHPDEWMQSAQTMTDELIHEQAGIDAASAAATWDWRFTCYNSSHPPHLPDAVLPVWEAAAWELTMQQSVTSQKLMEQSPAWLRCPNGMQIQLPIRNTLFPSVSEPHSQVASFASKES